MKINFQTNKLVILHYPGNAGGKFLSLCLNLHKKFLPQNKHFAKIKMEKNNDIDKWSFSTSNIPLDQTILLKERIDFGCKQYAGFNYSNLLRNPIADEKMCNHFWKFLTNQQNMFFCMVDHTDGTAYSRYVNRKTITLINYEWLLQNRKIDINNKHIINKTLNNQFFFNMETINNAMSFQKEICKLFLFFDIVFSSFEHLEIIRKKFFKAYLIGY